MSRPHGYRELGSTGDRPDCPKKPEGRGLPKGGVYPGIGGLAIDFTAGVRLVWIVDPDLRTVTVSGRPDDSLTLHEERTLLSFVAPGAVRDVGAAFASFLPEDIRTEIESLLGSSRLGSAMLYSAFPGEANDVAITGSYLDLFLLVSEVHTVRSCAFRRYSTRRFSTHSRSVSVSTSPPRSGPISTWGPPPNSAKATPPFCGKRSSGRRPSTFSLTW